MARNGLRSTTSECEWDTKTIFQNAGARRSVRKAGDTMPTMKKFAVLLLALLLCSAAAGAQEFSEYPYEFILAKLAADDGRFDEALSRLDKLAQKNPDNAVLRFERAMIMLDASRGEQAEAELRKVVATQPNFYEAERILGRLLLDRAANDRAKVD